MIRVKLYFELLYSSIGITKLRLPASLAMPIFGPHDSTRFR